MSIIDFLSDAGTKLFGKKVDLEAPTKSLSDHIRENDMDPSNLRFAFSNNAVTVSGTMPTQEEKEKVVLVIGNVQGIAHVDDQIVVAAVGSEPESDSTTTVEASIPAASPQNWGSRTDTVVSGDNLSAIAQKMYGRASKYPQIFEANKPMLSSPDKIYPGQVLRIPDLED